MDSEAAAAATAATTLSAKKFWCSFIRTKIGQMLNKK